MKKQIWYRKLIFPLLIGLGCITSFSCSQKNAKQDEERQVTKMTAKSLLGNPEYQAISFGGYRDTSREIQPSIEELKEDMLILSAMGIKFLRTYHTKRPHALNTVKAIAELKNEDPSFEMYVMAGAWIDCKGAWTDNRDHSQEDSIENEAEIKRAVKMAQDYPDIVKVIAVGNEAMVKWADSYYVEAGIILKWVNFLQGLKKEGVLDSDLWITSSDNFASWGGGDEEYHTADLKKLIQAVDYISMHTYPMHDTHYNPDFWGIKPSESELPKKDQLNGLMDRALEYAIEQYRSTRQFISQVDPTKSIHIGETGWASESNGFYGDTGSKATDEYKQGLYYKKMREWTNNNKISCFYFEAFNEPWKDAANQGGSENHFGLFDVNGKAKYPIWNQFDNNNFEGLTRGGNKIIKTHDGDLNKLIKEINTPEINPNL